MTPIELTNMILGIVISVGTIVSISGLGIRWLVKHYLDELKPNSGSSLKDQITRVETRQQKVEDKIEDLYDKFIDYLSNQNK